MSVVKEFLNVYPNKSTRKTYRAALKNYFESLYGPEHDINVVSERYFVAGRNYESDVQTFFKFIYEKPPKTVRVFLSVINSFLSFNKVELSKQFWKGISRRIRGKRARTRDRVPSNTELRKILTHMDSKGKAFFLMLASSGMRIGEALKLKLEDIILDKDPVKIEIRGEYTKTGDPRITFISSETKEVLEEWLKIREAYIKTAIKKSHRYTKPKKDERIFPFTSIVAYCLWNNALDKAQLNGRDSSTNRRKLHPHVLRKFFRTRMGPVISIDVAEALMGHEGYLTEVYRRYTPENLAAFYKEGEHAVSVFAVGDVTKLKYEMEERDKALSTRLVDLHMENQKLKQRLQSLEKFQKDTLTKIGEYAAFARELKSLLPEDKRKKIVEELQKRSGRKRQSVMEPP